MPEQRLVVVSTDSQGEQEDGGMDHQYADCLRVESNFKSPTKRSFLNECIRQIYILNGQAGAVPIIPSPIEFDARQIWSTLNWVLQPERTSKQRASLQRVKRQLFRPDRCSPRKGRRPKRLKASQMQVFYFRPLRFSIGVKKIPRGYLNTARYHGHGYQRSTSHHTSVGPRCAYAEAQVGSEEWLRKTNASSQHEQRGIPAKQLRMILRDSQCQQRLHMNEKMLEESIRSLYYMKVLLSLMMSREEPVYV